MDRWGLPQNSKILWIHLDEKWFHGIVPRTNAKACPELGILKSSHSAHHKKHIAKVMAHCCVGYLFEGDVEAGGDGFLISCDRCASFKMPLRNSYVSSRDATTGKLQFKGNAIKHTNNGGRITIRILPSSEEGFLTIDVIDNGSGIDPNYISKIFNRFYHHGGNMDRYVNGFGIGLSLTKSMIELHKGTISVSSELNIGTTFTLNLPLVEKAYSDEDKSDKFLWDNDLPRALSIADYDQGNEIDSTKLVDINAHFNDEKPTILFVDDNKDLIENMADYFMDNYNIYTADNGQIGVEMANKLQPDIIISDLVMPIMNGIELCETLKNDIKTSHIPIILLTAQGDMNTQFEGVKSGADYFVPKPFNIKILNLTIKNIIDSRKKFKNLFLTNKYEDASDLTTNTKDKEFIEKLLKYVNDNIEEDNLNIINIADKFSMSRSTFFRKVKIITGTTGKEFIDSVRLKRASKLLLESDLNISEIAYAIGHSNPQYFSKWFKSHYKMSPSEYILKNKIKDINS